ncbi:MAG: DUF4465 domain-containing protein [Paludibacteraceae bacterium]|nr:DUF4465 domain-containing protein [Paludibacteraceae bacterium]
MNKFKTFFWLLLAFVILPHMLKAEDVRMPQFGHQTIMVSAGSPVTFYDMNGYTSISSSSSNNSFATTIFQPAEPGNSIKIEFENIDVRNDGASWPAYLKIYDGIFDVSSVTYPTTTSGVVATEFPSTDKMIEKLDGTFTEKTYISSDASGALSVCYHYKYAKAISGWKATVSSVTLSPMTLTSAAAEHSFVDTVIWQGKQDVSLSGFSITTDGYSSPVMLQSVSFTTSGSGVIDASDIKLYIGQAASVAELTLLDGTISENDGILIYNLTTPQPLTNGKNIFCLGSDVLSGAPYDATTTINITGITTSLGVFADFEKTTPATLTVQPVILMSENAAYDVSRDLYFYDDGGKNGKINSGFSGVVTFRPKTNGKKVQINFSKISLHYTEYAASSTDRVDHLYIYDGSGTTGTLLFSGDKEGGEFSNITIKSTALDGSLTVKHTNNVSISSQLKDGWESVVSEFTPVAMIAESAEQLPAAVTESQAGATNVPILGFNMKTQNTEPALTIKQLLLNLNNTFERVSHVRIYLTPSATELYDSRMIGEADVLTDNVVVEITNGIPLREGDNYLWVACDISADAVNEERITIVPVKAVFYDNSDFRSFDNIRGNVVVNNTAVQACGSQTFNINGIWQYTHTAASEYSSNYKAENCEQIIVFKPATEGNLIEINYSDFDVYYSSSSYGTKAKYIVYSGEGTSGTKLWELDNNGKRPYYLRSASPDGALTVVFNPNTTSSYYVAGGWHAAVSEYTPHDMAVDSISVEQASTKLVTPGEEQAQLLYINIKTLGTLNPLILENITISLKGTSANIDSVYLLKEDVVLAVKPSAETVMLELPADYVLQEYDNNLTIAASIKQNATIETIVDAALLYTRIDGQNISAENADPAGSRIIKNVLYLSQGDNGTFTIGSNSLMFYDDGGDDRTYTKGLEGYVTFVPEHEGYAVEAEVKNYKLSNGADVKIYYGTSHEGSADATISYNYSSPNKYVGDIYVSSATDGSLTIYFKDGSYGSANDGWEIEIREHLLVDLSIDSVYSTDISDALQTVGAKDLKMLKVAVSVSGDRTPITIDALTLTSNENVTSTKIYQTGTIDRFADTELFVSPYTISERGTYYFWVTADASATADDDDIVSVKLLSLASGSQSIQPTVSETAQTKLAHGMSGIYTIGNDGDFRNVQTAVDAMNILGIEGNVVFVVNTGTYNEHITFNDVVGTSAAAHITFQSATGKASDVIFRSNETSDSEGVWTINGTDYLTLKNITFSTEQTGYAACLVLKNQSHHATLDGCVFTTSVRGSNTSQNCHLIRVISEDADNANCDNLTIKNCSFNGGYYALNFSQGSYATHPHRNNYTVQGNTFTNQEKTGIYCNALKNLTVEGNNIVCEGIEANDARALDVRIMSGHYVIAGNTITLKCNGGYANAIYFATNGATNCAEGSVVDIYNNAVYVETTANSPSSCLRLKWQREVNVSYNTLLINGTYTSTSTLWLENFNNLQLKATNNIIQNNGTGNCIFGVKGTYSHNALYSASGAINNTKTTFSDWLAAVDATAEDGNLNEQTLFASNSLLLLRNAGNLISGVNIEGITKDITGKTRAATPTIGAYEYDSSLFVVPTMTNGYPHIQNVTDTTAEIVLLSSSHGNAKVVVLPATADIPDVNTIITSGRDVHLTSDIAVTFQAGGLTEETEYKAYIVLLSPLGDASDTVLSSASFTTAWTIRPIVLEPIADIWVDEGSEINLTAIITQEYAQARPYSFVWYTVFGDTLANSSVLLTTAEQTTEYVCQVSDTKGQSAYLTTTIRVRRESTPAGFEEYTLSGSNRHVETAWADNTPAWLYSGTYAFANTPNKKWDAYNGYAISSDTGAEATGNYAIDQFRSAAGGAYEGDNFAVAYYSAPFTWGFAGYADTVRLSNIGEPQTISGFYITNTAYTQNAVLNGDYANPAFGKKNKTGDETQADYLLLTVSGYNDNNLTGTFDFYLADYRDSNADEHYSLDTWQWLDLTSLGQVTELRFDMFTTKSDEYGFTTPTYFALDNFGGKPHIDTLATLYINDTRTINLSDYFEHEARGKVTYDIVSKEESGITAYLTLDGSLTLTLSSNSDSATQLLIRSSQRGKQQYKLFSFSYEGTAVGYDRAAADCRVFPTLVSRTVNVSSENSATINVYAADGRCIKSTQSNGNISINTDTWQAGPYWIKVITKHGTTVTKIIKQNN